MSKTEEARVPGATNSQEPKADGIVCACKDKTVSPIVDGDTGKILGSPTWTLDQEKAYRPVRVKDAIATIQHEAIYGVCDHLNKILDSMPKTDTKDVDQHIGYCRAITDIYRFLKSQEYREAGGNV